MQELADLEVHPLLLSWIAAFLTSRKQAVRIGRALSDWLTLKAGVPQGIKLGVILFTVMTNKLLSDWRLRIKAIEMYFRKFCRKLKARNFDLDFYSSISVELVAPKMLNFAPKTKRNVHVWDSLPYPTKSTPSECKGGRAYAEVITKFSGIDSLPFSMGLRARGRSTIT